MGSAAIYLIWENYEDYKHRVLHIFSNHEEAMKFWAKTDGLPWWTAGARYFAKEHEVNNHNANLIISH